MSLFERADRRDVLRVCRGAVEHWARTAAGLVPRGREALARPRDIVALEDAIVRLFADAPPRRVDAVIESAWLPVMLVAPGPERRRLSAIEALLRERLAVVHDTDDEPVAQWRVQVDGLPGDRQLPGYGLPVRVREAIVRGLGACDVAPTSLQPAWAWARGQASLRATRRHTGWWFWQESDRTMLAGLSRGRVVSLHPALAPMDDGFDAHASAACEAARTGAVLGDAILASGWDAPRTPFAAATWACVAVPREVSA